MTLQPIAKPSFGHKRIPILKSIRTFAQRNPKTWEHMKLAAITIGSATLKPFVFDHAYQRENYYSKRDRQLLFAQECFRQFASTFLYVGATVTSWFISKRLFPKQKGFTHMVNALLGSSVLDIFVRPYITAKLSRHLNSWFVKDSYPKQPLQTRSPQQNSHPDPFQVKTPYKFSAQRFRNQYSFGFRQPFYSGFGTNNYPQQTLQY